jgi:phage-related protein
MEKAHRSHADVLAVVNAALSAHGGAAQKAASEEGSAWDHVKASIELLMAGGFRPLFELAKTGLQNLAAWLQSAQVQQWAGQASQAFKTLLADVGGVFNWLRANQDILTAVALGVAAIGVAILVGMVPAMVAATVAAFALMIPLLPLYALILAIGLLVAIVAFAWVHNFGDIQGKTAAVWAVLEPVFVAVKDWLAVHLPQALSFLGNLFGAIFSAIGTTVYNAMVFIAQSVAAIRGFFNALGTTVHNVIGTVVADWNGIVNFFRGIPGAIQAAVGNLGSLLTNAGADMVRGLWSGVQSLWGWVMSKIRSLVNQIPQAVRDLLGIGSPSKVFHSIGRNMVSGLHDGILSGMPDVARVMSSMSLPPIGGSAAQTSQGALSLVGGGGRREIHNHFHIDRGAFIDGAGIDMLANAITERIQYAPGT